MVCGMGSPGAREAGGLGWKGAHDSQSLLEGLRHGASLAVWGSLDWI